MVEVKDHRNIEAHESSPQHSYPRRGHRSCLNCHQRKVRCDRTSPCSPCIRAKLPCEYPGSARRGKGPPSKSASIQDVSNRLERVEALLMQVLDKLVDNNTDSVLEEDTKDTSSVANTELVPTPLVKQPSFGPPRCRPWEVLLQDGNRAHYVNNTNLLDIFEDEDRINPPELQQIHSDTPSSSNDPIMSISLSPTFSSAESDNHQLHPEPRLGLRLWTVYTERVDPVLKILHIPTMQAIMINIISEPKRLSPPLEVLAFAVYYAALTSLSDEEVSTISCDSRQASLQKCKLGLNHAMIKADLLNEPSLAMLQGLVIFATCLRAHDTGRAVWVLVGTAMRLAKSMGIHRDGTFLQLSPFESELRLRLWWQLWLLDYRSSEDHGLTNDLEYTDLGIRLPLNVNDSQLYTNMKSLPPESEEWTEASFLLTNIRATELLQEVLGSREGKNPGTIHDIQAKRTIINKQKTWMETNFFSMPPASEVRNASLIHYYTACAKMEFMLQLREESNVSSREEESNARFGGLKTGPFNAACRALEMSSALRDVSLRYTWLFKTYTQWYALAYVLRYLCAFPCTPGKEKVWTLINGSFSTTPHAIELPIRGQMIQHNTGRSSIWKCLSLLRHQAMIAETSASQGTSAVSPKPLNHGVTQVGLTSTVFPAQHQPSDPLPGMQHQSSLQGNLFPSITHQENPCDQSGIEIHAPDHWETGVLGFDEWTMPGMLCSPEWKDVLN